MTDPRHELVRSARRLSPRVERASRQIGDVLAPRLVGRDGPPLTAAQVEHLVDELVARLIPDFWCGGSCPELGPDGHGARRTGGGA